MTRGKKVLELLKRLPGWLKFVIACFVWFLIVEMGSYFYLLAVYNQPHNELRWYLHGMVEHFHPLFHKEGGDKSNDYYPYLGYYAVGDWSKTPPPAPMHPDGWVFPVKVKEDGTQVYATPKKPEGMIRVIALGGSTMMGAGTDPQTWGRRGVPAKLQEKLRAAYPDRKIEVLNTAFVSFTSVQELVAITTKFVNYEPDLIVIYDGWNDFQLKFWLPAVPPFWSQSHEHYYRTYKRTQSFTGTAAQLGYLLSKRLYCLAIPRVLYHLRRTRAHQPKAKKTEEGKKPEYDFTPFDRALDEMFLTHKSIVGVAREHKFPLILALQPNVAYRKPVSPEEEAIIKDLVKQRPLHIPAVKHFFSAADKRYDAFAKKYSGGSIHLLNLTGVFENTPEQLYFDQCHFSEHGAGKMADALMPTVVKALKLPPKK